MSQLHTYLVHLLTYHNFDVLYIWQLLLYYLTNWNDFLNYLNCFKLLNLEPLSKWTQFLLYYLSTKFGTISVLVWPSSVTWRTARTNLSGFPLGDYSNGSKQRIYIYIYIGIEKSLASNRHWPGEDFSWPFPQGALVCLIVIWVRAGRRGGGVFIGSNTVERWLEIFLGRGGAGGGGAVDATQNLPKFQQWAITRPFHIHRVSSP
jgi:hypothetical protein